MKHKIRPGVQDVRLKSKKVRGRRRSLTNVKPRRQMNARKAGPTDRGRVKRMGIGVWA